MAKTREDYQRSLNELQIVLDKCEDHRERGRIKYQIHILSDEITGWERGVLRRACISAIETLKLGGSREAALKTLEAALNEAARPSKGSQW